MGLKNKKMKWLIIHNEKAFYTNWYDYVNNYVDGMIVIDNINHQYSTDGRNFYDIEEDHL